MRLPLLALCLLLSACAPRPLSHTEAIAEGWADGSDGYWVARTGAPLDLTPQR